MYLTINTISECEYLINKSRFIGYAIKIKSKEEAELFINKIKKEHYKSTHVCYGYAIGYNITKANDDKEPSGTAGIPILNVLKQKNFSDTLIVVVRYYGGIKLGTAGLIKAYSHTANLALNKADILEVCSTFSYLISFNYPLINVVESFLNKCQIINKTFETEITYLFYCDEKDIFTLLYNECLGKISLIEQKEIIIERKKS